MTKTADLEAEPHDATSPVELALFKPGKRVITVLSILTMVNFIVALDATILVAALPTINVSLDGTTVKTFWVSTSFLLAESVLIPFMGAISHVLGRKEVLMAALVLFTIGSIVAAVAHSMVTLIIGRVIQGIGAGGITPLCQIILTDLVPLRQRPMFNSFNLVGYSVGTVLGPVLGGLFSQFVNWRWIFYFNLPFCGLALISVQFLVRLVRRPGSPELSLWQQLACIDWLGGIIFIASMSSFLIAITWAGVLFSWSSFHSLVPLIVGFAGLVATTFWEKKMTKNPFIRMSIFNNSSAVAGFSAILLQGFLLCLHIFYIPFYFIATRGYGPTHAGVTATPIGATFIPTIIISGALITRTGHTRWTFYAGSILLILGNGLLLLFKTTLPTGGWVMILVTIGIGHGILFAGLRNVGQAVSAAVDAAHAAAMAVFLRVLGNALGVAIGAAVLQNRLAHQLSSLGLDPRIAVNAVGYATSELPTLPAGSQVRENTILAYQRAMETVFEVAIAVSALIFVLITRIEKLDLNKEQKSVYLLGDKKQRSEPLELVEMPATD